MTRIRLTWILIWFLYLTAGAQQPLHFDRIGREDGLSQNSVNCMLRDRDGFMWFGTQDGLNLYDGKQFRVFQSQPGDSQSISNNYIVSICEDPQGVLWVGTMTGGLNRFDKHKEIFNTYLHSDSLNSITENTVWTVIADGDRYIWAGTSYGLNRLDKQTGLFKAFRPVPGDNTSLVTDLTVSLFVDRQGELWVGTVEGLCRYDRDRESFTRFNNPMEKEFKGADIVWSVSQSTDGKIITATDNGVYLLDAGSHQFTKILGSETGGQLIAWSVARQDDEAAWVGTDHGLFRIGIPGYQAAGYVHDAADPYSLADNNVWCLLPDPGGFLWAGTNSGISKTRTTSARVGIYSDDAWQPVRLSSKKIMAVLEDHAGNLWIGTDGGGLNRLDPARKSLTVFNSANSGLRNDNVWALAEDAAGNIYIGNYQGGLHRYNAETGSISAYPLGSDSPLALPNRRVLALLVDRSGILWIGTRGGGLSRLNPASGQFDTFTDADADLSGFPSVTVLSLAMDGQGRVWAGTQEGGLALYLPDQEKFRVFRHITDDPQSLSENNVWAIEFDSKGRLWAGTQGGLNFSENPGESATFRYLTVNEGLISNIILGIREDDQGDIWMSSFNGIARLDEEIFRQYFQDGKPEEDFFLFNPMFTLFDTDHGLQGLEFNAGASFKGHDGTLYFGGNFGLNYFDSRKLTASNYVPPVVITDFKIFNRDVMVDPRSVADPLHSSDIRHIGADYYSDEKITYAGKIVLTYHESVFSVEFSSLDYLNSHKNKYAYKMIGFDEHWNYMGTKNTATYTNLDPGEYTLVIRGSNSDGIWNAPERKLEIKIIPPFWKTTWFILVSVIISILIIFLIIRYFFIQQRNKARRDKELIELQLKTIKSQIDPHFAFNAINTITSFIFSDKPDVTYDYFTRFARMMRNILEDDEKIARRLGDEIEFVRNYLELQKMRFGDKFIYTIKVDENIPANTQVPKMILQSYAENAIKHGLMPLKTGGLLAISVSMHDSVLELQVEDNGVGREKAALNNPDSTRRGFRIMERTIGLYSKLYATRIVQEIEDLRDEKGLARGTRAVLRIYPSEETRHSGSLLTKIFKSHGKQR
jgi:ligand-binding sensor domain-containing protein